MKLSHLKSVMSGGNSFEMASRVAAVLPRYAAMAGLTITAQQIQYNDSDDMEIPDDKVREILALDFAERRTEDLRKMGEGIAKLHLDVNVPSNVNVWQHLKGDTALSQAVMALAKAANTLQAAAR